MFSTNTSDTDRVLRIVNIFLQTTLFNKHIKREDLWVCAFSRVLEQVQGNRYVAGCPRHSWICACGACALSSCDSLAGCARGWAMGACGDVVATLSQSESAVVRDTRIRSLHSGVYTQRGAQLFRSLDLKVSEASCFLASCPGSLRLARFRRNVASLATPRPGLARPCWFWLSRPVDRCNGDLKS